MVDRLSVLRVAQEHLTEAAGLTVSQSIGKSHRHSPGVCGDGGVGILHTATHKHLMAHGRQLLDDVQVQPQALPLATSPREMSERKLWRLKRGQPISAHGHARKV
jgi:hypothetical protein